MKRIILVDDHELIREGISELVSRIGAYQVIAQAANGQVGLALVETLKPDIVLMDVDMPVMNGLEATLQIKRHHKSVKVIVLTMHDEPALIKRMMEIGADGFLLKNADRSEFVDALARVAAGKTYFSSDAAQAVISGKRATTNTYQVGEESLLLSTLSERELEILKEVAAGFTNKEIADKLFISHRTVDAHRTNVMKKLEIHNAAGLVKFALQNGLVKG